MNRAIGGKPANARTMEWHRPLWSGTRFTVWILIVLVIAAVAWASVTKMQVYALVQGKLEPKGNMIEANAGYGGRVLEVRVKPWDHVSKGDVLLVFDALATDARDSAAQLEKTKLEQEQALQALALAQVDVSSQQRLFDDQRVLYDIGAVARNDFENARDALRKAHLSVSQANARLAGARLEQRRLEERRRTVLFAPVSGQVASLSVEHPGELVAPGAKAAEIVPDGVPLVLRGYVAEADRPKLRGGAVAEVSWNAYPRQKYGFTAGRVTGISPTSAGRYEVLIGFDHLELRGEYGVRRLLPGMTAEARAIATTKTALEMLWDWVRGVNPWD
jgi:multidrug efflux pump subunit AcrA (membrane-fusion protein)